MIKQLEDMRITGKKDIDEQRRLDERNVDKFVDLTIGVTHDAFGQAYSVYDSIKPIKPESKKSPRAKRK